MSVTEPLISKIIDANDVSVLDRFGLLREDFATETERAAYDFVRKYAAENKGAAPSYVTITANVPGFTYMPAITDSFEYLARKIKETSGKQSLADFFNGDGGAIQRQFDEIGKSKDVDSAISGFTKRLEDIRMRTSVRTSTGIDIALQSKFLPEYDARKAGTSFRIWRSKFHTINAQIGGYFSGNTYAWYARSGRGKSILVMEDGAIEPAFQGATVLVWSLEMSEYEWMARAFTSISARSGLTTATVDGTDYEAGFENRALLMASLSDEYETAFRKFMTEISTFIPGRIILRASDSEGFTKRTVAQLEADIRETKADVVVIDPIYLMDYEKNTSQTKGGDVAATSVKLKRLAGQLKCVIHVVTQAEEDASEKGEDGVREMKPPKRAEMKKSKAILEDAANVFGIDTLNHEGRGVIELGKGRNGGEDTRIEIVYLPNWGIVREPNPVDQAAQFTKQI